MIVKGLEARGTIDDISTGETIGGGGQRQEIKREHDTRFLEGDEHLHFDGDIYEDYMETTESPHHF